MKRNLVMLGMPVLAGLSLTLASCGGPVAEQEEGVQQPGAAPTSVEADEDEDEPQQDGNAQEDEDENENENE